MNIRDRVEQNVTIWLLGTLLTGFLAGFGAYKTILVVSGRTTISIEKLQVLEEFRHKEVFDLDSKPTCEKYGVKLVQRSEEITNLEDPIFITGSTGELPVDFELWIAATRVDAPKSYYPRTKINVVGPTWEIKVKPNLKNREDSKHFSVFLVGPDGQALIHQYKSALRQVASNIDWPAMTYMTNDMDRCEGNHLVTMR